jgi:hypothetical protein
MSGTLRQYEIEAELDMLERRAAELQSRIDLLKQERSALADECSHPPHRRIADHGDETFFSREGCLDCNTWLAPVRLRRP